MDGTVLIADDDRTIRTVLTQAFTRAGCRVHATASLATLMHWIDEGRGDLVITDVVMPDGNGITKIPEIAQRRPGLPVIVISAQNTITTVVQASEASAYDYMPKPFDLPDLMKRSARALAQKRKSVEGAKAKAPDPNSPSLIGHSTVMQDLYRSIANVVHADIPILITGESGTGKSLVARAIHDLSDRSREPFVVALADDLENSDTTADLIERCTGGALVFDEVGDLPDAIQARIVRVMDRLGHGAPRIISTSQTNLLENEGKTTFRSDLYFRLAGVTLSVPPLRNRLEDITPLARHFLSNVIVPSGSLNSISTEALDLMRTFTWPGNVRQFENTMKILVATAHGQEITKSDVEETLAGQPAISFSGDLGPEKLSDSILVHLQRYFGLHGSALPAPGLYGRIIKEVEIPLIEISLEATGGNQAKCADLLGINRNTLRKKITELDIHVARSRKLM